MCFEPVCVTVTDAQLFPVDSPSIPRWICFTQCWRFNRFGDWDRLEVSWVMAEIKYGGAGGGFVGDRWNASVISDQCPRCQYSWEVRWDWDEQEGMKSRLFKIP